MTFLSHKETEKEYLLRELTFNDENSYARCLEAHKKRLSLSPDHLTHLIRSTRFKYRCGRQGDRPPLLQYLQGLCHLGVPLQVPVRGNQRKSCAGQEVRTEGAVVNFRKLYLRNEHAPIEQNQARMPDHQIHPPRQRRYREGVRPAGNKQPDQLRPHLQQQDAGPELRDAGVSVPVARAVLVPGQSQLLHQLLQE